MAYTLAEIIAYISKTPYLKALVIFILSYLAMQLILFISEKVFLRLTKKTKTVIDDLIVEKTRVPLAIFVMALGARISLESIQWPEKTTFIIEGVFNTILVILGIFVIGKVFNIIIDNWAKKVIVEKQGVKNDLFSILHKITYIIIYAIGLLYILHLWGIQIGPLVASLGIAGIAVAFALQNTLSNLFGGAALIVDSAFKVGDIIELDDGTLGTVDKVSLRSTKVKTFSNEIITLPNGKLADSKIKNWCLPDKQSRVSVPFSVAYGTDVQKIKDLVLNIIKKDKEVLKDPEPVVIFMLMGEYALQFEARFWIKDVEDKMTMKDKVTTKIYDSLRDQNIEIPFPTRTIYMKNDNQATEPKKQKVVHKIMAE